MDHPARGRGTLMLIAEVENENETETATETESENEKHKKSRQRKDMIQRDTKIRSSSNRATEPSRIQFAKNNLRVPPVLCDNFHATTHRPFDHPTDRTNKQTE